MKKAILTLAGIILVGLTATVFAPKETLGEQIYTGRAEFRDLRMTCYCPTWYRADCLCIFD